MRNRRQRNFTLAHIGPSERRVFAEDFFEVPLCESVGVGCFNFACVVGFVVDGDVARLLTAELVKCRRAGEGRRDEIENRRPRDAWIVDYLGGCERIHKTPIPFAYMVHVRRALIMYCLSLPAAIAGEFGWVTVPITFLVCYVFIGIEEIGVEIEDPFGDDENDLPLEAICQTIERNLFDLTRQYDGHSCPSQVIATLDGQECPSYFIYATSSTVASARAMREAARYFFTSRASVTMCW